MATVAERPAPALIVLVGCVALGLLLAKAFAGPDPAPERVPRVVRVDSSKVLTLPSEGDESLVLAGSRKLSPGQFVTAAPGPGAPEGFLLEVHSSDIARERTVATVEPASLYEAVPNGALVANPGDFEPATEKEQSGQREPVSVFAGFSTSDFSLSCKERKEIGVTPKVESTLRPDFDVRWTKRGVRRWSIESASAHLVGGISAQVEARAAGGVECEGAWPLVAPGFTAVVTVGPVPVPIRVSAPLQLSATAHASGAIDAHARAGMDASAGLEYDGRRVWPRVTFDPSASIARPAISTKASARLSVVPSVKIEAGWKVPRLGGVAAAAQVELAASVDLTYSGGAQPSAEACFPMTLGGQFTFTLPLRRPLKKRLPGREIQRKCIPVG